MLLLKENENEILTLETKDQRNPVLVKIVKMRQQITEMRYLKVKHMDTLIVDTRYSSPEPEQQRQGERALH